MKMKRLGKQGPEISVVGFGAWEAGGMIWGEEVPEERTIRAIQTGFDSGMNWIDTAEVYGRGRSEEIVGRALGGRDDALVFTKVAPRRAGTGFHAEEIKEGARKSLERLRRDRIDLYQLHWPDPRTPVEETWGAMSELVDDGLARWIGVSNFDRDLIERCEQVRHVDSLQPEFSMLHRDGVEDLFPFCATNGTGILAYGPLAAGLLTGAITKDTEFHENDGRGGGQGMGYHEEFFAPGVRERHLDKVERLKPIADRIGASLPQLALAWVFHQEGVTGAIAGSRSPEHVKENAAAGEVDLQPKDLEEIDSILNS